MSMFLIKLYVKPKSIKVLAKDTSSKYGLDEGLSDEENLMPNVVLKSFLPS